MNASEENVKTIEPRGRGYLVLAAFLLFSLTLLGLLWLATTPGKTVTLTLSYAAGISMIALPCTLPMVFVIVPLSMGRGYKKGLLMAILFGLGLSITLTAYGVIFAQVGGFLGLDRATRAMFLLAGLAAFAFGLSELRLLNFSVPGFSRALPPFLYQRQDYLKALLLGLFLGNAGVGCPNPAFYVLVTYIASTGDALYGGLLGFIHGVGRATPLLFLVILALLGVNASQWIAKKRIAIDRIMGWGLAGTGAFILTMGAFGAWFDSTWVHVAWNDLVKTLAPTLAEREKHLHDAASFQGYAPWAFFALLLVPLLWYTMKNRLSSKTLVLLSIIAVLAIVSLVFAPRLFPLSTT